MCLFLQSIRLLCLSNRIFSNYVCIAGGREEYQRGFFQLFYSFIINTGNNGIGKIVFFHETQQGFQLARSVVVSVCPLNLYSPIRLLLGNIQADNVYFTLLFCIYSPIMLFNRFNFSCAKASKAPFASRGFLIIWRICLSTSSQHHDKLSSCKLFSSLNLDT